MSKYAAYDPHTGKYEDIVVKRRPTVGIPSVMLGSRVIGQVGKYNPPWKGWYAVSHAQGAELRGMRLVEGFHTRRHAIEYLLRVGVERDIAIPCTFCHLTVDLIYDVHGYYPSTDTVRWQCPNCGNEGTHLAPRGIGTNT